MKYMSVCSGIEAATVAWEPLGWKAVAYSEIEPFPCAVLNYHYPTVPNIGDMTKIKGADYAGNVDLIVGGTPCQSFSIAGLRGGLGDDRGNLALVFMRLVDTIRPKWVVWENVPGVLSSNGGRDFGSILGALAECGYGFAYRVLDAQYIRVDGFARAVPQRRRRVFLIGSLRGWQCAAAVLFERYSLQGHSAPSRKAGKVAPTLSSSGTGISRTGNERTEAEFLVVQESAVGFDIGPGGGSESSIASTLDTRAKDGPIRNQMATCVMEPIGIDDADVGYSLRANASHSGDKGDGGVNTTMVAELTDVCAQTLGARDHKGAGSYRNGSIQNCQMVYGRVRRLTPMECERLQGFPDNYSRIPYRRKPAEQCPDGPRYAALGNSMCTNVMRWIGQRIQIVNEIVEHEIRGGIS